MLLLGVDNIDRINIKSLEKIKYYEATNDQEKLRMLKELIEVRCKYFHLENIYIYIYIYQELELYSLLNIIIKCIHILWEISVNPQMTCKS